ncbi:MAG TPA: hypothetical protein VF343_05055 [Syntrophales bacterium]
MKCVDVTPFPHRSYCICSLSQVSGVPPKALDRRIAISGDTPL